MIKPKKAGRPKRVCGNYLCTRRDDDVECYARCHYTLKLKDGGRAFYCVHHGLCHRSPPDLEQARQMRQAARSPVG